MIVKTYNYTDTSDGKVNQTRLDYEISTSGTVTNFQHIITDGACIKVLGDSESGLDAIISAHEGETLAELKNKRNIEINNKSETLIAAGFTYDSELFDAQLEDRVNYGHMEQFQDLLPFPIDVHTKTGGTYSLEKVDLLAFIGAALAHVNVILGGGNALKALIDAALTKAEVDAILDNR